MIFGIFSLSRIISRNCEAKSAAVDMSISVYIKFSTKIDSPIKDRLRSRKGASRVVSAFSFHSYFPLLLGTYFFLLLAKLTSGDRWIRPASASFSNSWSPEPHAHRARSDIDTHQNKRKGKEKRRGACWWRANEISLERNQILAQLEHKRKSCSLCPHLNKFFENQSCVLVINHHPFTSVMKLRHFLINKFSSHFSNAFSHESLLLFSSSSMAARAQGPECDERQRGAIWLPSRGVSHAHNHLAKTHWSVLFSFSINNFF